MMPLAFRMGALAAVDQSSVYTASTSVLKVTQRSAVETHLTFRFQNRFPCLGSRLNYTMDSNKTLVVDNGTGVCLVILRAIRVFL